MEAIIKLYSNQEDAIFNFLNTFFRSSDEDLHTYLPHTLEWQKKYQNPIDMVDMIGTLIENNDKYKIFMWISLDSGLFIHVTNSNVDQVIRYIYERYPW